MRERVPSASEGLSDADIDAERGIAVALVERHADVEACGAEVRIVAHARTGADARRKLRKIGEGVGIGTAGIDEGHGAERLADALAELDAALDHARAAQRIVPGIARPCALEGE